jgi:hypothetical protein
MDNWEIEILNKIDTGVELDWSELRELVFGFEVDRIEGDDRCWTRTNESIVKLGNRFFSIQWEQGLTECQENEFDYQPKEVISRKRKVTKTITEWIPIGGSK